MRRLKLVLAIALAGAVALMATNLSGYAGSDKHASPRTMTISAEGVAAGTPDVGTINMGVHSEAKTASEALSDNNAKMARLIETLKASGIDEKYIQTSNFNVSPRYGKYDSIRQHAPLIGYAVTNQVHIVVKDLDRFGEILDAAVQVGANRIHGISFNFSNPQPIMDKARVSAVKAAQRKAELYAEAAGLTLGKVVSFHEQFGGTPRPVQARAMAEDMASVPVAVGESELRASVTIVYELE